MKTEIIAVGTELLMGQVVNTNATFLSEELAGLGYEVYIQTVVGDNPSRLTEVLALADKRSDLVILTGGLGPTEDDLTRETLASYLGDFLELDEQGYQKIVTYLANQDRQITANNRRQALTLSKGQALQNPTGLAVGTFYQGKETNYILLPGPPNELKPMFYQEVVPKLKKLLPQTEYLTSRVLRFFGIGESYLVLELADLIASQTNPTIAPYASPNEVRLRLTVKAENHELADEKLDKLEKKIFDKVGNYFYGYGEHNSLAKETVNLLKEKKKTLAVAESLTAGLVQSTLGEISGVSEVFFGGFVTYSNEMKIRLLNIPTELIETFGAVSEECAVEMARKTQEKTGSDYALSLTGVAGPSELEGKKVGTTWIALATKEGESYAEKFFFQRDRAYIQNSAMMHGLALVRQKALKEK